MDDLCSCIERIWRGDVAVFLHCQLELFGIHVSSHSSAVDLRKLVLACFHVNISSSFSIGCSKILYLPFPLSFFFCFRTLHYKYGNNALLFTFHWRWIQFVC